MKDIVIWKLFFSIVAVIFMIVPAKCSITDDIGIGVATILIAVITKPKEED